MMPSLTSSGNSRIIIPIQVCGGESCSIHSIPSQLSIGESNKDKPASTKIKNVKYSNPATATSFIPAATPVNYVLNDRAPSYCEE